MGKLTLNVNDELITMAKEEAALRGTSVSKLVGAFFKMLARGDKKLGNAMPPLPPVTASLVGCLSDSDMDKEDYIDYLEQKHS